MITKTNRFVVYVTLLAVCSTIATGVESMADPSASSQKKTIHFIADGPSHGYGAHDHRAGTTLLADHLEKGLSDVNTKVHTGGWPDSSDALEGAEAIVMYCDGAGGHVVMGHIDELDRLAEKGVGIVALHFAVEVEKGKPGDHFLDWIGGYFEKHRSINPHWTASFDNLPDHPITSGVQPFEIHDEWYYHMRFRKNREDVTPILSDLPPKNTLLGRGWKPGQPSTPRHGNQDAWNAVVEQQKPQVMAWARVRANGGRGFGFTGGHFHKNWAHDQFRKLVLNAIAWSAKVPVPNSGVPTNTPTVEELEENHNENGGYNAENIRQQIHLWNTLNKQNLVFESDLVTPDTEGNGVKVRVSVKNADRLYLIADPGPDGYSCDWVTWARPRLVGKDGDLKKLTELDRKQASSGWKSTRVNKNVGGERMRINGETVPYGIGTHAQSMISYELPEGYSHFRVFAGLDDGGVEQGCGSTVKFKIYAR